MDDPSLEIQPALSLDELRFKARYIRDIVAPVLASAPGEELAPYRLENLRDIFAAIESTPVTIHSLEHSRIDKAMFEICSTNTGWPEEFVVRAQKQLNQWAAVLGDITDLNPPLWSAGGRMHGIEKVQRAQRPRNPGKAERILGLGDYGGQSTWEWSVNLARTKDPRSFGHNGFEVGDWWIHPICASRDGIIGNTGRITASEQGVYAITLTKDNATDIGEDKVLCKWNSGDHEGDAMDARKLLRNVLSREPVRVLRTSTLGSKLAPIAGVRYDGLYDVVRHGLERDDEKLSLYFQLVRYSGQPDMSEALKRPMAEERDDSAFYHRIGGGVVVDDDPTI
ncbi:MAG: hypothetical protein M1840_006193 [Geoglossum simile]|nr:MAG: hypothetical protein M1840_006193 [Geoglossum simile]